jgi:hypothetical protein
MNRTRLFLSLAAIAVAILGILCVTEMKHNLAVTETALTRDNKVLDKVDAEINEMNAKADALSHLMVRDGFEIQNDSSVQVGGLSFRCDVDDQEQEFQWNGLLDPHTAVQPQSLFQSTFGGTSVELHSDEIQWLLAHHRVTGCHVFAVVR